MGVGTVADEKLKDPPAPHPVQFVSKKPTAVRSGAIAVKGSHGGRADIFENLRSLFLNETFRMNLIAAGSISRDSTVQWRDWISYKNIINFKCLGVTVYN